MRRLVKHLWVCCLLMLVSSPLLANQPPRLPDTPLAISPVGNDQYFVAYQSKRLPEWNFSLQINRSYAARFGTTPFVPVRVANVEAYSLSARRALPLNSPQWIYATLRSTQYSPSAQSSAISVYAEQDTAASVGWQFGELRGFGVAVGYEYRDVGELDINSLVMGVHYYF